jgi:hypothetical protein
MKRVTKRKWPAGSAVALYESCVLEIYELYEPSVVGPQVRARAVNGDWPGLIAVGVKLLHPVTPLALALVKEPGR